MLPLGSLPTIEYERRLSLGRITIGMRRIATGYNRVMKQLRSATYLLLALPAISIAADPVLVGARAPVTLHRKATSHGHERKSPSITLLPGRGLNTFQITANLPGKGETELLRSPVGALMPNASTSVNFSGLQRTAGTLDAWLSDPKADYAIRFGASHRRFAPCICGRPRMTASAPSKNEYNFMGSFRAAVAGDAPRDWSH